MNKIALFIFGVLVVVLAAGTAWGNDDDDDDNEEHGEGRKIIKFHTMAAAPGITATAPDSITFETLNTNCGTFSTFEFFLNDVSLGTTSGDQSNTCSCNGPTTTFVVNDAALIDSAWLAGQSNTLRFVRTNTNTIHYVSWSRAVIDSGSETETVCLFDYYGGNCDVPNLCDASFTGNSIDNTVTSDAVFVGTITIRGVEGAELARSMRSAKGKLKSNGDVKVEVKGLVLAADGSNPDDAFKVIVSCLSTNENNAVVVVNLETALTSLSRHGKVKIDDNVVLPQSCMAPVIFVAGEDGRWLTVSGR